MLSERFPFQYTFEEFSVIGNQSVCSSSIDKAAGARRRAETLTNIAAEAAVPQKSIQASELAEKRRSRPTCNVNGEIRAESRRR